MKPDYGLSTIVVFGALAAFVVIVAGALIPLLTSVGERISAVAP